jgi:hypothetical protein
MIRFAAGLAGFLILSHMRLRPGQYTESRRFDTMPSSPSLQACSNKRIFLRERARVIRRFDEPRG